MVRKLLLTLFLSFVFISSAFAGIGIDYNDANCQAAWLMDVDEDPIRDDSQNSNTAAVGGGVTFNASAKFGGGYDFDGTGDHFVLDGDANLDGINTYVSIVGYIYLTSTGIDQKIFYVTSDYYWSGVFTNNKLEGAILSSGTEYYQIRNESGGTALSTTTWYHSCFLFDGRYTKTYIDGVSDRTYDTGATRSIDTSDQWMYIGASAPTTGEWNGTLDEMAIFDDVLTSTEINDIMDNGLAPSAAFIPKIMMF